MGMFQALRGKSSSAFCLVWVVGWVSQHQVSAAKSFPPALPGEISCDVGSSRVSGFLSVWKSPILPHVFSHPAQAASTVREAL